MIVFDVKQHLENSPEVTALIGDRIYPVKLPQNPTYPAITYFQVSGSPIYTKQGRHGTRPRVQISCWAKSYTQVKQLAEKVKLAMDGYAKENLHQNETDIYEDDVSVYHVPLDFIIFTKLKEDE